jgi:hypothetical protein
VDKTALGQVFSEYFCFLCQSFHQFLIIIITSRVVAVPSGPNWTPPPTNQLKIKQNIKNGEERTPVGKFRYYS